MWKMKVTFFADATQSQRECNFQKINGFLLNEFRFATCFFAWGQDNAKKSTYAFGERENNEISCVTRAHISLLAMEEE